MKTAIEKIKETALAAAIVAAILGILSIITGVSHLVDAADAALPDVAAMAADSFVMACMAAVSVVMFADIAKSGTPFSSKSVLLLRVIAVILMLSSVISPAVRAIVLASLGETVTFTTTRGALFLGILVLLLVQIFSYGRLLQQESDETI